MDAPPILRCSFVFRRALTSLLGLFIVLFLARNALAGPPEPGDQIRITLHGGNTLDGELLGLVESGYRISFSGTEVIVAHTSIKAITVLQSGSSLEPPRSPTDPESDAANANEAEDDPRPSPHPSSIPLRPGSESAQAPARLEGARDQTASLEVPPKPPSRGQGLMVTGFVLVGVGAGVAVASATAFDEESDTEENGTLAGLFLAGGLTATAGIALSVTGIILKSISGAKRRRWEREYGGFTPRWGDLAVTPTFDGRGGRGLALVGQF